MGIAMGLAFAFALTLIDTIGVMALINHSADPKTTMLVFVGSFYQQPTPKLEREYRRKVMREPAELGSGVVSGCDVQQRVEVTLDERGVPVVVKREAGSGKRIESIGEMWRIDDEWWRTPIVRRYVEVILEGGGRVVLFEDLSTGEWWIQKPA